MVKFLSQLIGARVLLYQERAIVGKVARVLIDPDDGTLVGFAIYPVHQQEISYIPPNEVKGYGQGFLMVEGLGSLSEEADVIKIKNVLEKEPSIIGSKVYTESNQRLGKVEDATLDLRLSVLKNIYVNPSLSFGILGSQKIIGLKQIVKIEKTKIIVRDNKAKQKQGLAIPAKLPVVE